MDVKGVSVSYRMHLAGKDQFAKTPKAFYDSVNERYGPFDFDPCPVNPTFNGLEVPWGQRNYVNPPFNQLKKWLQKALVEWKLGKSIVFLMPVRLHTVYFQELIHPFLLRGEIEMFVLRQGFKFEGYENPVPFGLMYLVFPGKSLEELERWEREGHEKENRSPLGDPLTGQGGQLQ